MKTSRNRKNKLLILKLKNQMNKSIVIFQEKIEIMSKELEYCINKVHLKIIKLIFWN